MASLLLVVAMSTQVISARGGSTVKGKRCLAAEIFIPESGGTGKVQARAVTSLQTVGISKARCGTVNLMDLDS